MAHNFKLTDTIAFAFAMYCYCYTIDRAQLERDACALRMNFLDLGCLTAGARDLSVNAQKVGSRTGLCVL